MATLLAVDVGNTNVTMGVFDGEVLQATWRISTDVRRTEDEHALLIKALLVEKGISNADIDAVSMCSVVPAVTEVVRTALQTGFGNSILEIGRGTRTGIKVSYDRPQDVGTDRVVDAAAALALYGGPATIVDIGTATVFDAVSKDGEYLGGAIAPGMALAAEALYQGTAQLRRIDLVAPGSAIGTNTVAAMQSGIVYGYVGLIEAMVERFRRELSPSGAEDVQVIGTGGLAGLVARETEVFTAVDENLTLQGLRLLYEMNS